MDEGTVYREKNVMTSKTVTKRVEEGMRLRHAEVERASDKLSTAGAMAYLSHLDRGELLAEVERLRNALSQSIETVKRLMAESRPVETSVPLSGFMSDGRNGIVPDPNYRTRFKVGERILSEGSLYRYYPRATVTEITARGFKYRYDERINLGPRHGWYQEGESFTDHGWDLAADQSPCLPEEPSPDQYTIRCEGCETTVTLKYESNGVRYTLPPDSGWSLIRNRVLCPQCSSEKATERRCDVCQVVNLHEFLNCANCGHELQPLNGK